MSENSKSAAEMLAMRALPPLKPKEEMMETLLSEMYGFPAPAPEKVSFENERDAVPGFCAGKARLDKVKISVKVPGGEFTFPVSCVIPAAEGKHPFFVHINFRSFAADISLPTEEIVDNGFAVLTFCYEDVTKDNGDFADGLCGLLYPDGRGAHDGGKLAVWAWAASRVMDYAETCEDLDLTHAAVCGHSRLGKTALLAGALDTRFTHVYSNDSGCCGASLHRGGKGESLKDITAMFPFWFCNALTEGGVPTPEELPFDQHWLLACLAPRPLLVGSADKDAWADPPSEFLGAAAASEAYEGMGLKGLEADRFPEPGEAFLEGTVGYQLRPGTHYFSRHDWQRLMEFVRKH